MDAFRKSLGIWECSPSQIEVIGPTGTYLRMDIATFEVRSEDGCSFHRHTEEFKAMRLFALGWLMGKNMQADKPCPDYKEAVSAEIIKVAHDGGAE